MTPGLADYIEAGKAFDEDERLEAARQLLMSVDRDPQLGSDVLEAEWDAEIDRRVREIVAGEDVMVDGPSSFRTIRESLKKHRA